MGSESLGFLSFFRAWDRGYLQVIVAEAMQGFSKVLTA